MTKSGPTPSMVGASWRDRQDIGTNKLGPLLRVIKPGVVKGKRVLVFDDVFTSGTTLRIVALKLLDAGASEVDALVLARQSFGA